MLSKRFIELSTNFRNGRFVPVDNKRNEIDEQERELAFAAKEAKKLKSEKLSDIPRQAVIVNEYKKRLEAEQKAEKKARELTKLKAEAAKAREDADRAAKEAKEAREKAELAAKEAKEAREKTELAAKESKATTDLIARFKISELDENAILRLQKAYRYTGKPLEEINSSEDLKPLGEIYNNFHDLAKWGYHKLPAVKELLTNLGLTDFSVPYWVRNNNDYYYALMFKVIRDGKSFEEAKSDLEKLKDNPSSFTLLSCLASGIREEVISKLAIEKLSRMQSINFASLALPVKIYLASHLMTNQINDADWSNILREIQPRDDVDYVEKRIHQLQEIPAPAAAAEIKQAVRHGDAYVAPVHSDSILAINAQNADPEPRVSNYLSPSLFNHGLPVLDASLIQMRAVEFMAIKINLRNDGASFNVMYGMIIDARIQHAGAARRFLFQ
jgi:hypothetical protein